MLPLTALLFWMQAEIVVWATRKVLSLGVVREAMIYLED